jgi:hypothetical protein
MWKLFKTESGDWFGIPESQYEEDTKAYEEGLGDEEIMLYYESGQTNWMYLENVNDVTKLPNYWNKQNERI